jgi:hypothetical protein
MKEFEKAGVVYTGEPVTVDENLVTAENPSAARAFGEAIAAKLTTPVAVSQGTAAEQGTSLVSLRRASAGSCFINKNSRFGGVGQPGRTGATHVIRRALATLRRNA